MVFPENVAFSEKYNEYGIRGALGLSDQGLIEASDMVRMWYSLGGCSACKTVGAVGHPREKGDFLNAREETKRSAGYKHSTIEAGIEGKRSFKFLTRRTECREIR